MLVNAKLRFKLTVKAKKYIDILKYISKATFIFILNTFYHNLEYELIGN